MDYKPNELFANNVRKFFFLCVCVCVCVWLKINVLSVTKGMFS